MSHPAIRMAPRRHPSSRRVPKAKINRVSVSDGDRTLETTMEEFSVATNHTVGSPRRDYRSRLSSESGNKKRCKTMTDGENRQYSPSATGREILEINAPSYDVRVSRTGRNRTPVITARVIEFRNKRKECTKPRLSQDQSTR